jgi:hypothetical protein
MQALRPSTQHRHPRSIGAPHRDQAVSVLARDEQRVLANHESIPTDGGVPGAISPKTCHLWQSSCCTNEDNSNVAVCFELYRVAEVRRCHVAINILTFGLIG